MQNAQHTINGLTAGKLNTTQTPTSDYDFGSADTTTTIYWAWDVIKRLSGGSETVIGSKIGQVSRTANGYGIQSATWNCPETALGSTDAIVVRCYVKFDAGSWIVVGENSGAGWITEQLNASKLDAATWTIYTYTEAQYIPTYPDGYIRWGSSTYNTRIEGFSWTAGGGGGNSSTITPDGSSYWLENSKIKFKVATTLHITGITEKNLTREVAYFYFYYQYRRTWNASITAFYMDTIGSWTLTPSSSPLTTVTLTCTRTFTDAYGIQHNFAMVFSLTENNAYAEINFTHSASQTLFQQRLSTECNFYPQGYANQSSGGNLNVGGHTAYSVPLPYDTYTYVYTASGNITKTLTSTTILATYQNISAYIASYSSDASFGFFSKYIDMRMVRFRTLNAYTERQFMWFDTAPRTYSGSECRVTLYFGAWNVGSASALQAVYNALPNVGTLEAVGENKFMMIVRTDLNIRCYEYNSAFSEIMENIKNVPYPFNVTDSVNATLVPAGSVYNTFFKWKNNPNSWTNTSQDTSEDYVQKSIDMARTAGIQLNVEIDVLDMLWLTANPTQAALDVNGVPSIYWTKLPYLITNGSAYHDKFVSMVTYLCQNYNFYSLVMSECAYKDFDYSSEAKTLFLTDNPTYMDWPRIGGAIDVYNETLGKWKTLKLSGFWDQIKTIANANNKKFYLMVEPNFQYPTYNAWEYGQWYDEAIKHVDGLWLWGYYGYFEVSYTELSKPLTSLHILSEADPTKDFIISIGLWTDGTAISPESLNEGLWFLQENNVGTWASGVEVTPSKLMTDTHWSVLWGYPVEFGPYLPIMFIVGMIGLVSMISGPSYAVYKIKRKEYEEGLVNGILIFAIGLGFFVGWLAMA